MTVRYYIFQAPFEQTAMGHNEDAEYVAVWAGVIDTEGRYDETVLDRLWTKFQRVDDAHMPPVGYTGRSLSVGDVVQIEDGDESRWWACEPLGWKQIDATAHENAAVPSDVLRLLWAAE